MGVKAQACLKPQIPLCPKFGRKKILSGPSPGLSSTQYLQESNTFNVKETDRQNNDIHDIPDAEKVRKSSFQNLQELFDAVVNDEGHVDDAAAEDEVVPAVDVLNQLHSPEPGVHPDAAGRRKLKCESLEKCILVYQYTYFQAIIPKVKIASECSKCRSQTSEYIFAPVASFGLGTN